MKSTKLNINIKKIKKQAKGITLIALVVTIIVLLILAGVALNLTIGQNGVFQRAEQAANTWRNAEANEQLALQEGADLIGQYINGGSGNEDDAGSKEPIIDLETDTVYYADLTGDGTVDGVIYADLAVGGSGVWNNNPWSNYSYEAETGLKEYCIINEEYTDEHFGTGKVIAPIKGTSGKNRFYVMALEDVNLGTSCCWYDAAYGKLDNTVATNYNDFGDGRTNTEYVMNKWNDVSLPWGNHNDNGTRLDMCEVIEEQFNAGWFVPSKSEWSAFGDKFKITSSNYVNQFGLSGFYWSSSQYNTSSAYYAAFYIGYIRNNTVNRDYYVRLSMTF